MGYFYYNPNPLGRVNAGDCTVRAITKVLENEGYDWDKTYASLAIYGMRYGEMPSANSVWGSFLIDNGFVEQPIMKKCKECYTVDRFCIDHPKGTFVVCTDSHAIAVIDGNVWDSYDSRDMYPTYYFEKSEVTSDE